jgi:ribosome-binding protein aMBF1 (putative translation factor)
MSHSERREKALKKIGVKAAYDAMEPEFTLLRELLQARQKAGLSQADIAEKMGTKAPAENQPVNSNCKPINRGLTRFLLRPMDL